MASNKRPSHSPRGQRIKRRSAAVLALALASLAHAQAPSTAPSKGAGAGYRITWSTLDAGGGRSVGTLSSWRLQGTVGQAEAEPVPLCSVDGGAACAGARFSLRAGFWPGLQATAPGAGCVGVVGCLFRDGFEVSAAPGAQAPQRLPR